MALHGCIATGSYSGSFSDLTPKTLDFTTEVYDSNDYHSNSTNPNRFTAPVDGFYHFLFYYKIDNGRGRCWHAYITGSRDASPYHNGPATHAISNTGSIADGLIHAECIDWYGWLDAGDWVGVTLTAHTTGGGDITTSVSYRASITNVQRNLCKTICRVHDVHIGSLTLPAETEVEIPWSLESIDTSSMWSNATVEDRKKVIIPSTGYYQIFLNTHDTPTPDTYSLGVHLKIKNNGTEILFGRTTNWRQPTWYAIETSLTSGDIITVTLNNKRSGGNNSNRYLTQSYGYNNVPSIIVRRIDE